MTTPVETGLTQISPTDGVRKRVRRRKPPEDKDAVPANVALGVMMRRSAPRKRVEIRGKLLPDLFDNSVVGLAIFDTHLAIDTCCFPKGISLILPMGNQKVLK
jgi:hypothetical protein